DWQPAAPIRNSATALKSNSADRTALAGPYKFFQYLELGPESQYMRDHQHAIGFTGCFEHTVAIEGRECHRLLAQHMLSGGQSSNRYLSVQIGREADVDHIICGIEH